MLQYLFIYKIVHLSIQVTIFHPTDEIGTILNIANSKKLLIVINTDSLRNRSNRKYRCYSTE